MSEQNWDYVSDPMKHAQELDTELRAAKQEIERLQLALEAAERRKAELEAVVGKLPVSADGAVVIAGETRVFHRFDFADSISEGVVYMVNRGINLGPAVVRVRWERDGKCTGDAYAPLSACYSTREALEAADSSAPSSGGGSKK